MFEFLSTGSLVVCSFLSNSTALIAQAQDADGVVKSHFWETGWFLALLLVSAIVLGIVLAKSITRNLRLSEYANRMAIVLVSVLVAALMIWSKWPPAFGVDLRGGINIVGSLNLDAFSSDDSSANRPKATDIIDLLVQRVNPGGTEEIMIRALGDDKIEVTIPSVNSEEADKIWDRLVKAGKLEFRIVADQKYHSSEIALARQMAAAGSREREVKEVGKDGTSKTVAYWAAIAREVVADVRRSPNDKRLIPMKYFPQGSHLVRDKSTGRLINMDEVFSELSGEEDMEGRDFARWLVKRGIRTPQVLLIQPDEKMNVEGSHLYSVKSGTDNRSRAAVDFVMRDDGSSRLLRFTRANKPDSQGNVRLMAIVLDDQVHSAPQINEPISKQGQISGSFTQKEVDELVVNLNSGKLDVALNKSPISRDFITSTLGEELKEKGIWAIGSSLALVLVFMLVYYRFAGIVATVVLVLNVVFILALIMAIGAPLTLTGLAGLVLTVGMSVDANVLIFERIREEMDRGAALRMAIRNGFDKATTTIVDANVTTLITAIVLYVIGTEQIKGFSVTLVLGILMSMFTAIFVARLIFDIAERKRWLTKLNMTRLLERNQWTFLNKVPLTGVVSVALILIGIGCLFSLGNKILDKDLRGGSMVRMVFNESQNISEIRDLLRSQEIEVNGEKIEFTVSGFGVAKADDPMKDRVFKVDSNLPAWEGDAGEVPQFEQLDELLSRIFAGKLMLHHVDIVGSPVDQTSEPSTDQSFDQSSIEFKGDGDQGRLPQWRAIPTLSAMSLTSSILWVQDAENSDAAGTTSSEVTIDSEGDEVTNQVEATDENSETPATKTTSEADVAGGDFDGGDAGSDGSASQELSPTRFVNIKRTLKVEPAVAGKTLRSLIVEASQAANLGLEEDQVVVNSPDVLADESALTTISTTWDVTLNVTQDKDADTILAAWADSFNQKPYFPTSSKVGGQIAASARLKALAAVFASLLGIVAYIWIRFQNVAFGLAAVIALIHDVAIVLGAIALSHWLAGSLGFLGIVEFKISLEIIAALLTVIGYSLNDTIVVFDRIREVRGKRSEITAEMINQSISQTLSRTILTSLTTFVVVFILYCFGGEAIHGFAFALCVGIIVGTYSSIFVASPALLWLMNTCGFNPGIVDPAMEN